MHDTLRHHKVTVISGGSSPLIARKVRPNDKCPCGSGKKAKYCHGTDTKYCHGTDTKYYRLKRDEDEA